MTNFEKGEQSRFAPLEHWREYQQLVSQELNNLAEKHVDNSNGRFTLLDIDPDQNPAQKISTQSIDGTPANIDELILMGQTANGDRPERFTQMISEFIKLEDSQEFVSSIGEDLLAGQNIIVITNHSEIQDIAEALVSCHIALKKTGNENNRQYPFTTNIMLSKMIAHLGLYDTPAVDILKQVCNKQYFSFPKTNSIRGTNIPDKLVTAYNWSLRQRVKNKLRSGSNLFGIAPSGTVDKALNPDQASNLTLAPVLDGTIDILTSDNTKVLPIAVYKTKNEFIFEILGIPRHMRDAEDVHQTMDSIAKVLDYSSIHKRFSYLRPTPR